MASKRILKELKDLQKDPPTSCSAGYYVLLSSFHDGIDVTTIRSMMKNREIKNTPGLCNVSRALCRVFVPGILLQSPYPK